VIAVDTETTSLYWHHGAECFAIGAYDGKTFSSQRCDVDPYTRSRLQEFSVKRWREMILSHDIIVMHNAGFDLKALCQAGVFTAEEVAQESFWKKIVDTSILSHLHNSKSKRSLKVQTKINLDHDYEEEDELSRIVKRCRGFVSFREPDWLIADKDKRHPALIPCQTATRWHKMDMWLPQAVLSFFPVGQLKEFFEEDYDLLNVVLLKYLKQDCVSTYELAQLMFHDLIEEHGENLTRLLNVNMQVQHVIWKTENRGVHVYAERIKEAIEICTAKADLLLKECHILSGFDVLNDTTLRQLLFEKWNIEPVKVTPKGVGSVDAKSLIKIRHKSEGVPHTFLGKWIAYKKYLKKLQFLEGYRNASLDSRMYPSFNIVGTDTLRFSSSNPNGQNIEKNLNPFDSDDADIEEMLADSPGMRSMFGPEAGRWWICMDYSQLQLRIFAVITGEQDMQKAFAEGWDGHDYTMHRIFSDIPAEELTSAHRRISKNVNFGFIFGASPRKIEETAGRPGLWDVVTEMFPNAHSFISEISRQIKATGIVRTAGGYPLKMELVENKWNGRLVYKAHAGVNYIVQGTEGEIVKRAMYLCDKYITEHFPECYIPLQVHDEFVFDVPAYCSKAHLRALKQCMEQAAQEYGVLAPAEVELVTSTWNRKQEVNLDTR